MIDYVQLRQVKETKNLSKFLVQVVPEDLLDTLRQVSMHEVLEQVAEGNRPSAILVDGTQKPIPSARRRVVSLYTDTAQIAAALHDAFRLLQSLTRRRTGKAQGSYRLLLNDTFIGDESAVDRTAARMTDADRAIIIGPLVVYGRRLYWNPATGGTAPKTRKVKKSRGEYRTLGGQRVKIVASYQEPIHRAVQRILQRQYRALTIKEAWPVTPFFRGVGDSAATPGLMIRVKRGRAPRL